MIAIAIANGISNEIAIAITIVITISITIVIAAAITLKVVIAAAITINSSEFHLAGGDFLTFSPHHIPLHSEEVKIEDAP